MGSHGRRKPVIDKLANIGCLAGCTGRVEFGKATYEGRGRNARITAFHPIPTTAPLPSPAPDMPSGEAKPATGRKNKIHRFSACAVAKALGKAGVKWEEANRILHAHGIEMPKASLSVQLGLPRQDL